MRGVIISIEAKLLGSLKSGMIFSTQCSDCEVEHFLQVVSAQHPAYVLMCSHSGMIREYTAYTPNPQSQPFMYDLIARGVDGKESR